MPARVQTPEQPARTRPPRAPAPANLYGPQPNFEAIMAEAVTAAATPEPPVRAEAPVFEPEVFEPRARGRSADEPWRRPPPRRRADAAASRPRSPPPASAPPCPPRSSARPPSTACPSAADLESRVRAALAGRIHVLSHLGTGARRVAFVGAGGAGKSTAIAHLARAYADADAGVVVLALRSADGGRRLANELEPHGVTVIAAADAEQGMRRLARYDAALTLIDTPAAGPGDDVAGLAADLEALGAAEVHLALPATMSAAAADELHAALAPLGITHVALTHADATARPGAPIEVAMTTRTALSYVCGRSGAELAEPTGLAQRLLP